MQASQRIEVPVGVVTGSDGRHRCAWASGADEYPAYHDHEWGFPVADDRRLFEKICLEGFQSGLSWLTILRKRPDFRRAFRNFEPVAVARFNKRSVERLLGDAGIVRHRGKIEATIANARAALRVIEEFGTLAAYVWRFEPPAERRPAHLDARTAQALTESPESRALSKDLKARGFRFVGPTTIYAFMQSMGLVNDHLEGCHVRPRAEAARGAFERPRPAGGLGP